MARQFHLAWFLGNAYGVHAWKGPWTGAGAREWSKPDFQIDMARALERARFDYLLMEDSSFVPDDYGGSIGIPARGGAGAEERPIAARTAADASDEASRYRLDDLDVVLPAVPCRPAPRHAGPHVRRTRGREHRHIDQFAVCPELRTRRAHRAPPALRDAIEFADAMKALWDSWEEGAVIADLEADVFVDPPRCTSPTSRASSSPGAGA
jgi:hypothetical protein